MSRPSELDPQRSRHQFNPLIPLFLGLRSSLDRLADELERPAEADVKIRPAAHDPLILLALGLMSLRQSVHRWSELAAPAEDQPAADEAEAPADLRDWLR